MSGAILGVDYGAKRVGLAIAEGPGLPAMPLATLANESRRRIVEDIGKIARERGAETIVVGYPLRLDGTRGPAAENIDRFVEQLRGAFTGAIVTIDERMTTGAATQRLRSSDLSGKRARAFVDRIAAVEILQSFLAQSGRKL